MPLIDAIKKIYDRTKKFVDYEKNIEGDKTVTAGISYNQPISKRLNISGEAEQSYTKGDWGKEVSDPKYKVNVSYNLSGQKKEKPTKEIKF